MIFLKAKLDLVTLFFEIKNHLCYKSIFKRIFMSSDYKDIIDLDYEIIKNKSPYLKMSAEKRAAQFRPFIPLRELKDKIAKVQKEMEEQLETTKYIYDNECIV